MQWSVADIVPNIKAFQYIAHLYRGKHSCIIYLVASHYRFPPRGFKPVLQGRYLKPLLFIDITRFIDRTNNTISDNLIATSLETVNASLPLAITPSAHEGAAALSTLLT